jgi:hypothetical protein
MKSMNCCISSYTRNLPDAAEPDIISTIKKTFNFGQSEAVHLFQTLMECMKKKELVSRFQQIKPFISLKTHINW